jgi:site-specific DNA-methyltransferase (adenine-specific)
VGVVQVLPESDKVYKGDCIEVMGEWDDGCVDHCITDPPYSISKKKGLGWAFSSHVTMSEEWDRYTRDEYLEFSRTWLREVSRVVKPNGNIFVFGSYHSIYDLGSIINEMGLRIVNSIVYYKPNAQPCITCRTLTESTEYIIWACNAPKDRAKGWYFDYDAAKSFNGGKQLRNVWEIPCTPAREKRLGKHPNQKPLALMERLVRIGTKEGDMVLDPLAGSGTTVLAASQMGRHWVAIEKEQEYIDILKKRLGNKVEEGNGTSNN